MRLALTVRHGYDQELVLAQRLGVDAVVARLDLADPQDTDLGPVVHDVRNAGLELAAVELFGMPDEFQPWSDGLTGALLAAEAAGVGKILCASPTRRAVSLAADLEAVVATATATSTTVCLDSSCLLPEELAWLPAGNVHIELVAGLTPLLPTANLSAELAQRIRAGGVDSVRFEGGGRPLDDGPLDVPGALAALAGAGFDGHVRPGAVGDLDYLRTALLAADSNH